MAGLGRLLACGGNCPLCWHLCETPATGGIVSGQDCILVEFQDDEGRTEYLSKGELGDLGERSTEAVQRAMGAIKQLAEQTLATLGALEIKPDQSEVEFGVVFKAEVGALIAKTASEGSIKVKLTWKHEKQG